MSCFPVIQAPTWLSYFTAITSCIMCVVVTSGNSLIILSVFIDPLRRLRTPFSYFLVNLAVTDLIVGTTSLPIAAYGCFQEVNGRVPGYIPIMIHVTYFIPSTASVLSLGAMCVDRYIAIKWPIKYRQTLGLKRCLTITTSIWVFTISVSALYFAIGFLKYLMVFVHVSIFLTFVTVVMTYRQVYKTLHGRTSQFRRGNNTVQPGSNTMQCRTNTIQRESNTVQHESSVAEGNAIQPGPSSIESSTMQRERKVTKAFFYILCLFVCCYAPTVIMVYILQFCPNCNCTFRHVLRDFQFVFVWANSAMNPVICAVTLTMFRQSIFAVLRCRGRHSVQRIDSMKASSESGNVTVRTSSNQSETQS